MKLFTVATHNYGYYPALIQSAKEHDFNLINLAKHSKWKGLLWKFKLMYKSICNLDDNEIIAFCDGFDVLVVNNAKRLEKFFKLLDCDIIFGNENSNNNPLINFLSHYAFKYQYLLKYDKKPNTGVYVGYVGKIKQFLKICLKECGNLNDDQDIGYKIFYYQKKYNLKLRIVNEHIYTIPFSKKFWKIKDYRIVRNIDCDLNKTFFIHGNGNRNIDIYCKKLKLPLKLNNKISSNHSHFTHYLTKLINNNRAFLISSLILLLIIGNKKYLKI